MSERAVAQIDDTDLDWIVRLDHDILRLQVRMDDVHAVKGGDGLKELDCDFLDNGEREKARVGLERCEQVVFKKVSLDE